MKSTQQLHDLGQSLWLDNITRGVLRDGTLQRYIDELSVTGLTSNPTIFFHAIEKGDLYDDSIRRLLEKVDRARRCSFVSRLEDLREAADLFRPVHESTGGVDGWVSLELSPLLANDTAGSIRAAVELQRQAQRPNVFIKIPGTPEGVPAIEESIFRGVPINVTLLFSAAQYVAVAEAYMRGIERRLEAGLDPRVESVASLFVSRWDVAVQETVPSDVAQSPRHRGGATHVPGIPARAGFAAMARARVRRRAAAAYAVGQHRNEGSQGTGHDVRRGAGRSGYDRHDARQDAARVRGSRCGEGRDA